MALNDIEIEDNLEGGAPVVDAPIETVLPNEEQVTPVLQETATEHAYIASLNEACEKLRVIRGVSGRFTDMKDVANKLADEAAICSYLASEAANIFGKDILGDLTPKMFTSTPTKTNFAYVSRRVQARMALEELALVDQATAFFDYTLKEAISLLDKTSETSSTDGVAFANGTQGIFANVKESDRSAIFANIDNKMQNVLCLPLSSFSIEQVTATTANDSQLLADHAKMLDLAKNFYVRLLAFHACTGQPLITILQSASLKATAISYEVTLGDLFALGYKLDTVELFKEVIPTYCFNLKSILTNIFNKTAEGASTTSVNGGIVYRFGDDAALEDTLGQAKDVLAVVVYSQKLCEVYASYVPAMLQFAKA